MTLEEFLSKLGQGEKYYWINDEPYGAMGIKLEVDNMGILNAYTLDGIELMHNVLEQ